MKIRSLSLENFRQFYGKQDLLFAEDEQKNVTVVYGANGAGKTTLLNAFTWSLYGIFSAGFERSENLINERVWSEAKPGESISARVSIVFEDQGLIYTVTRVSTDRKLGDGSPERLKNGELSMEFIGEDGRINHPSNPSDRINQILPERLHAFFFFNGERIEALAKESAYEEIGQAIKNILGLEIVERAIRHLDGQVRKQLQGELREVGTREIQDALDVEERLSEQINRQTEEQQNAQRNEQAWKDELEAVNGKLRGLDEARGLQELRDRLEENLQQTKASIAITRQELSKLASQRGFLAFTQALCNRCSAVLEEKRKKGEIPTGIKRQFVNDLLERHRCICGTELHEGEAAYNAVSSWLSRAGTNEVEESSIRVAAAVGSFNREREELFETLDALLERLTDQRNVRRRTEEQLSEITRKLSGKDSEEVRSLESRRDRLLQQISHEHHRAATLSNEVKELQRQLKEQKEKTAKLQAASERAELAQRRLNVCTAATEIFRAILETRTEEVREALDERVKEIYSDISYKPYSPVVTDDYRLTLHKTVGTEEEIVAKSTGENQILSLSFIGAIAAIARERYQRSLEKPQDGALSFRGGIYPVVMDSPFGNLDENYRAQIAQAIPKLAPQTIVFVSKSQGLGSVQEELAPKLGRQYVLSYHTSKQVAPESITLGGQVLPYIEVSKDGTEYAEVKEVI
jgi:DNA sulfur modification protein DndD